MGIRPVRECGRQSIGPSRRPEDGVVYQRPIRRIAERRVAVTQLDRDDPGCWYRDRSRPDLVSLLGLSVVNSGRTLGDIHMPLYVSSTI